MFTCLNDVKWNALSNETLHQSKIIMWIQICFCFRKVIIFLLKIFVSPTVRPSFFPSMLQETKYLFCLALALHFANNTHNQEEEKWNRAASVLVSTRCKDKNVLSHTKLTTISITTQMNNNTSKKTSNCGQLTTKKHLFMKCHLILFLRNQKNMKSNGQSWWKIKNRNTTLKIYQRK